jgi:adenine-specific DNA-methyltransferase
LAKPIRPYQLFDYSKFKFKVLEKAKGHTIDLGGKRVDIFSRDEYEIVNLASGSQDGLKEIWATGTILDGNSSGRFFRDYLAGRSNTDGLGVMYKVFGMGNDQFEYRYFTGPAKKGATKGKYYQGVPTAKLCDGSEIDSPIENYYDLSGAFGNCRTEGGVGFRSGKKPEVLLQTILDFFSNTNDLVLDSFLGSGTTAAVAHKMGRRYIGIEMGEHAITHCVPRLKKVVDGEKSGISKAVNWQGGGGFRFYRLGEPVFDENNHINPHVTYPALAAHCWFSETKTPLPNIHNAKKTPLLGVYNGTAYYLLFNGILGDQNPEGGNVLTQKLLRLLPPFTGPKVIYGEVSLLDEARLRAEGITFKKIPYELSVR